MHSLNYALNYTQPCFLSPYQHHLPQFSHLFVASNPNLIARKVSSCGQPLEQTILIAKASAIGSSTFAAADPSNTDFMVRMLKCLRKGYSELFSQFTSRPNSNDQIMTLTFALYPLETRIKAPHLYNYAGGISFQGSLSCRTYFDLKLY